MSLTRDVSVTDSGDHRLMEDRATPVRRAPLEESAQLLRRGVAVVGLAGIALVHVVDATGKFHETPYLGWAYVVLIVGCLAAGGMLIERDDRRAWIAAAGLSAAAFVAYALSRTTGLPSAKDDIGNWFETLGLATLFTEVLVLALALRAITAVGKTSR
jgi:hypothetical protein